MVAQLAGEVPVGVDPEQAATTLLALCEGLGVYVLNGQYTSDDALTALDSYLDLLVSRPAVE